MNGMFFCNKCGAQNEAGAQLCSRCGAPALAAAGIFPTVAPALPHAASATPYQDLLFSFKGRITRSEYWGFSSAYYVPFVVCFFLVASGKLPYLSVAYLQIAYFLLTLYPTLAVTVKRCHDRGKSGWFILVGIIPIVNLWFFIEILFLRGGGENKYGPPVEAVGYGGYDARVVAAIIDAIILRVLVAPVGMILGGLGLARRMMGGIPHTELFGSGVTFVLLVFGSWLYEAFMESSSYQATLGKMIFGMKVTDLHCNRISFGRATGRHFAKFLSGLTLLIGYIMAAFTERKQALHDMLAGTLVRRN